MPYSGPTDESLPDRVKEMPAAMRKVWIKAFNNTFYDCEKEGGEECDGKAMRVANSAVKEDEEMATGFMFVDLQASSLIPGKPFAGFAAGTFVDMFGREVELKAKDIKDFVTNTLALIADFQGRGMPGLPIDEQLHNKGKAAGWIVSAEPGEVQDTKGRTIPVIRLVAEWTKVGVELIRDKIMANFSPTVDLKNKVLRGGSLTNWPATQDERGVPLFEAVELSQGIWGLKDNLMSEQTAVTQADEIIEPEQTGKRKTKKAKVDSQPEPAAELPASPGDGDIDMTKEEMLEFVRAEMRGELQSVLAEILPAPPADGEGGDKGFDILQVLDMAGTKESMVTELKQYMIEQHDAMRQEAQREAARQIALVRREAHVAELCRKVVGGTEDHPHGIPVNEKDLQEFLCRLPEADLEFAKRLLTAVHEQGLIEYAELGHGRRVVGTIELEAAYAKLLNQWVKEGNPVSEFFSINPELGEMNQYNLSKYQEAK